MKKSSIALIHIISEEVNLSIGETKELIKELAEEIKQEISQQSQIEIEISE